MEQSLSQEKKENSFSQYKKLEKDYQDLMNEINIYQKRQQTKQKENIVTLNPKISEKKKTKRQINLNGINIFDKEQLSYFFQNQLFLQDIKDEIIRILYQNALEMNEMAKCSSNKNEKIFCQVEIKSILELIQWIINYKALKEPIEIPEKKENKLIFLQTETGRVTPYDELNKIPDEQKELFELLLKSIQNESFKGFKNLSPKDLLEVRYQKARIIFRQIQENIYLIASCFIKKVHTDNNYKNTLNRLEKKLNEWEPKIKLLVNSSFYLEEQKRIETSIFTLLTKKRDDINARQLCRINQSNEIK